MSFNELKKNDSKSPEISENGEKSFIEAPEGDEKNLARRKLFGILPGAVIGLLFVNRAEAGTWKKLGTAKNASLANSMVKADGTGQLAAATAGTDYAKPDTSSTWTAKQTFSTAIHEKKAAVSAMDIDVSSASVFTKTISGATTFTVSNVPTTGTVASFILELTNPGSAAITWWTGVKWAGGTVPTFTSAGVDILGFYTHDGGTTWRGLLLAKDSK